MITQIVTPERDWLPVFLPGLYVFTYPDAELPGTPLTVKIEASINGTDFAGALTAGITTLPPNAAGEYAFNPHAYLESMFEPSPPVLPGIDHNLFKYYRLVLGPYHLYDGTTGTPELVTTPRRVLYATELSPIESGFVNLTRSPYNINSPDYPGISSAVWISEGVVKNSAIEYDPENPDPVACPAYPIELYWLNRNGGWQSYVFDGKHEYEEEVPDALMFEDYLGHQHKAAMKGMRNGVRVFSGYLRATTYETVRTIRSAIRVYQNTADGLKEVNIKPGTFKIRKEGNRLYECNFAFTYAEPVLIQTA